MRLVSKGHGAMGGSSGSVVISQKLKIQQALQ